MENEMIITKNKKDIANVENNKPSQIVKNAMEAAKELQRIVNSRNKKLILQGKQYLFFEDWQTLGRFDRTTAKVIDTEELYQDNKLIGFSAKAVAVKDGTEISAAEAECCFDEPNWKNKPRFQLKSMAQTRACAKALRNCLAFIAVLANYEPTPAEEMVGNDSHNQKSKSKSTPPKEEVNTDLATQPQKDKIYGTVICEKCGTRVYGFKCPKCKNADSIHIATKGFIHSHLLTKDDFKNDMKPILLPDKLTKINAMIIWDWWLGDSKNMVVGERTKREAEENKNKPKKETKADRLKQAKDIVDGKLEVRNAEDFIAPDEEITDKDTPGSSPDNAIPFTGKRRSKAKVTE